MDLLTSDSMTLFNIMKITSTIKKEWNINVPLKIFRVLQIKYTNIRQMTIKRLFEGLAYNIDRWFKL